MHVVHLHDACVVDQHIQFRILLHQRIGDSCNALAVLDVEFNELYPGIRDLLRHTVAESRDDDLVAFRVQRLRETAPDTRTSACDEDRVARQFHARLPKTLMYGNILRSLAGGLYDY